MTAENKELKKDIKEAVSWFAAEYKFLTELKQDIVDIEKKTDVSDEEKAYKKARRALRYVLRSERRGEKIVEDFLEELKQAVKEYPELAKLGKGISISSDKLLKAFSLYTGEFRKKLSDLITSIGVKKHYAKLGSVENIEAEEEKIKAIAKEIEKNIDALIKWLDALSIDFKRTQRILKRIQVNKQIKEKVKPKKRYFRTSDNVSLWYELIERNSKLKITLLCGNEVNHTEMLDIRNIFDKAGFSTLIYDPSGHGKSSKPKTVQAYKLEVLAKHLLEITTALGFKRESGSINLFMGQSTGAFTGVKLQSRINHFDALVLLTPSHDYKKTLRENSILFQAAKIAINGKIKLLNNIKKDISIAEKRSKTGAFERSFSSMFAASRRELIEGEITYKLSEIPEFRKSVKQKPIISRSKFVDSFFFGSKSLRKLFEKSKIFNRFYTRTAVLAKSIKATMGDAYVNIFYMKLGLSKDTKTAHLISKSMLVEYNIEKELKRITVPTLLIVGDYDLYLDPDKLGRSGSSFKGSIISMNGQVRKGIFPTTLGLIKTSKKELAIVHDATHTLSFSHPYDCCWRTAYFIYKHCKGLIDPLLLREIMHFARNK